MHYSTHSRLAAGDRPFSRPRAPQRAARPSALGSVWWFPSDFEDACIAVRTKVNDRWAGCDWWDHLTGQCPDIDVVKRVLSCYINLASAGTIAEYAPPANPGASYWEAAVTNTITKTSICSTVTFNLAWLCLDELYHLTIAGDIDDDFYLYPKRTASAAPNRVPPIDQDKNFFDNAIESIAAVAKWVFILGGIGAAVYVVHEVAELVDAVDGDDS